MLRRRGAKTYDKSQQVIHWLSWLAQQMARCNQSEFYLERMQIDWLPDSWLHWLLPIIGVGLVYQTARKTPVLQTRGYKGLPFLGLGHRGTISA
jgi:hypothetical protein